MITYEWYSRGSLFGLTYRMEKGDALPVHSHEPDTEHNVIVLRGQIELRTPGEVALGNVGDILDFDGSIEHTVACVSDNATILNLFLNGMPAGYADLPSSEHQGVLS